MNYKEKYEKALERAKKELGACGSQDCDAARQIFRLFPELKEAEDERIRKELIAAIKGLWDIDALPMPLTLKRKDEWLAWLEKQGEQKASYTSIVETGDGSINALVTRELPINGYDERKSFDYEHANIQHKDFAQKQGKKPRGKSALEAINEENNPTSFSPASFSGGNSTYCYELWCGYNLKEELSRLKPMKKPLRKQ